MKEIWNNILDMFMVFGGAAMLWIAGEAGRIAIAGGAGALVRWWASEQRNLRNGIVQALTGAIVATYMWPLVFGILHFFLPSLEKDTETIVASGFVAGMMGMSVAKIALALIENFTHQHRPQTDKEDDDRG
ncbi:MAG: hypothetical protein JXQ79_10230 [Rhodobacteraceae bacterium]|nr:hypothetical protein [Paracoccaceae bacterium]